MQMTRQVRPDVYPCVSRKHIIIIVSLSTNEFISDCRQDRSSDREMALYLHELVDWWILSQHTRNRTIRWPTARGERQIPVVGTLDQTLPTKFSPSLSTINRAWLRSFVPTTSIEPTVSQQTNYNRIVSKTGPRIVKQLSTCTSGSIGGFSPNTQQGIVPFGGPICTKRSKDSGSWHIGPDTPKELVRLGPEGKDCLFRSCAADSWIGGLLFEECRETITPQSCVVWGQQLGSEFDFQESVACRHHGEDPME